MKRDKTTDARAIAHHYDVSNDFYALFLDPLMVYTCAYYRDPDGKLEQAQQDKLDHVCRKLDLRPGETLLDIGCGWGGLSMWAARHYGVRAQGVTLSRAQADYAAERIKREGLERTCRVDYMDYRDLPPEVVYDKIAAIGVIEHVGIPNYPAFFGGVRARLKDGGLYLNHGIVHDFHWKRSSQIRVPPIATCFRTASWPASARRSPRWSARAGRSWTSRACACTTPGRAGNGPSGCARAPTRRGPWPASPRTGPGDCTSPARRSRSRAARSASIRS